MEEATEATAPNPLTFRSHRPGDIGWIIHRHGVLYSKDCGLNERFEALVAKIGVEFIETYDATKERSWIAERDGQFLGCIFLVKDKTSENTAKLRMLLVEPIARGLGLGRQLVQKCLEFAREVSYGRVVLQTSNMQKTACRIYESAGFRLVSEEEGCDLFPVPVGWKQQIWELIFSEHEEQAK
ncbi:Fc.00g017100.m01.CDS01 [Cosmosporella sp. VM-42]